MSYLDELNESQRDAVENIYGPTMVIAGAGSGKTRVLTFRIAHMMRQGIDPFNIMALTFTNKAAKEMTERIEAIVGGGESRNITMGTFHSVFSRILRYNADRLGYPSNFTIYDTQDSKSVLKDVIKGLNLDEKEYKPSNVLGRISSAKNNLISPDAYAANEEIKLEDTNYAQYLIVKKLAAVYENICVVGDDAQSIYSFRGANIQNILNFKKDYPDFKLYKLEQNYRSTKNIVEAANGVISKNKDQIQKTVWTSNDEGSKITVVRTLTDNEEGKLITNKIYDKSKSEGLLYNDFAILYRTNRQSR